MDSTSTFIFLDGLLCGRAGLIQEIMLLAKQLYPSDIRFMTSKNDALGGASPLSYLLSGEADKVLDFLKKEKLESGKID